MGTHSYPVEVQSDFLEKITKARPAQALAELIWNSLDADATKVETFIEDNVLGAMSSITVRDNGAGFPLADAPTLFKSLGGSWKRPGAATKGEGRFLHGQDGRGRFKAFALARVAEWAVTYRHAEGLRRFTVTMNVGRISTVEISDEAPAAEGAQSGVTLTLSEPLKNFPSLTSDPGHQELTEIFALYLVDYEHVTILVNGRRIDPASAIASRKTVPLPPIDDEGKSYPTEIEIIEWRSSTNRALFLCNAKGFPLSRIEDRRFHVGSFQFSAYLKSEYVSKLQKEGTVELAEMNPIITTAIDNAKVAIKDYFRSRASQEARSVVEDWKDEHVYPYEGKPETRLQEVERQVFDIVAVNVAQHLPDFSSVPQKNKAFSLRLLRQAIETGPEELQVILDEVLKLPKRKQEELAELLREVSLSAIIGAAKIVADRLRFLTGLEAILFDADSKKRLKERSQLQRIIVQNCWLFGEEYNLSVDDQSLTEVLRKHRALLDDHTVIDEPVKHVSKERGIVDMVLSRTIRRHRANELLHLVVELKAPKVKIDKKEVLQIEEYAMSVMQDERFRGVGTKWVFWAISDDYGAYAEHRMKQANGNNGRIYEAENATIWVKTWAQVIDENRARLQFFQEKLEYQADKEASLSHLKEHYAKFLQGVLVEEEQPSDDAQPQDEGTEKPSGS